MPIIAGEQPSKASLSAVRVGVVRPSAGLLVQALTVIQGAAFIPLLLDGTPWWGALRIIVVAAVTVAAMLCQRHGGPAARGIIALVLGIAGTVAGAGIGALYLAKAGFSLTTVAGLMALVTGLGLLAGGTTGLVGALRGWWRLLAVPGGLAILVFVLYPLTLAVNVTNRPATPLGTATPAASGLAYQDVTLHTADDVRLSAWYVPSINGAAVVLLHGAGSTRSSVLAHAAVLARHGYGVLLLDTRGHGRSKGRAMDWGWYGDLDIAAAVTYLRHRPEINDGGIGAVGMSMGGEQAVAAAGSDPRIRAVVSEGTTGMQLADHGWLPGGWNGWIERWLEQVQCQAADILSGAQPAMPLRSAIRMAAPRPMLLIAAGNVADERAAADYFRDASPRTVAVWVVPGAGHTAGLATQPAQWEARVTGFLDQTLAPSSRVSRARLADSASTGRGQERGG